MAKPTARDRRRGDSGVVEHEDATRAPTATLERIAAFHADLARTHEGLAAAYGDLAANAQNDLAVFIQQSVHALVPPPPEYLTAADVGELLQVSERTVHRLVADGNLPEPIKISPGRSRWSRRALDEHFANGGGK